MECQKIGKIVQIDQKMQNKQTNKKSQSTRKNGIQQVLTKCFWTMQPSSTSNILQLVHLPKLGITARKKDSSAPLLPMTKSADMKMCAGGRIILTCDHKQKN